MLFNHKILKLNEKRNTIQFMVLLLTRCEQTHTQHTQAVLMNTFLFFYFLHIKMGKEKRSAIFNQLFIVI